MASTLQNSDQTPDALELAWMSGDDEKIVAELKRTKSRKGNRAEQVIRILQKTPSPRVRNAAAVALADMRAPKAAQALIEMLDKPEGPRQGGTLLYALEEIKGKAPLRILVNIILSGSYEARQEALGLIESGLVKFNQTELRNAAARLRSVAPPSKEQDDTIKRALEEISDLRSRSKTRKRSTRFLSFSTKALVSTLSAANQLPKKKMHAVLDSLVDEIATQLHRGNRVRISKFGIFAIMPRIARMKPGAKRAAVRGRKITFQPSNSLNQRIDEHK